MSLLITFEGVEGCGKSYQSKFLCKRLISKNVAAILTYEPGGTALGNRIRHILKKKQQYNITPEAELFLFSSCRTQLLNEVILPALLADKIVICDRFTDSTIAYQGYGRGIDFNTINEINQISVGSVIPDLTILLDLPVENGLQRKKHINSDRFDSEELDFHNRIRNGYLQLASNNPERWLVINGLLSKREISKIIWQKVSTLVPQVIN